MELDALREQLLEQVTGLALAAVASAFPLSSVGLGWGWERLSPRANHPGRRPGIRHSHSACAPPAPLNLNHPNHLNHQVLELSAARRAAAPALEAHVKGCLKELAMGGVDFRVALKWEGDPQVGSRGVRALGLGRGGGPGVSRQRQRGARDAPHAHKHTRHPAPHSHAALHAWPCGRMPW